MPSQRVVAGTNAIYLTFDDGPDPISTPAVLELLQRLNVKATFFLVAEKARTNSALAQRIQIEGHAIGNHSLDHRYGVFFRGLGAMLEWIQQSERVFQELGLRTVGFRPPAGVRTPELHRALYQLETPLIMWRKRFFDTILPWTPARAKRSVANMVKGSIVLLHDRQPQDRLAGFLEALEAFVTAGRARGLEFRSLTVPPNRTTVLN